MVFSLQLWKTNHRQKSIRIAGVGVGGKKEKNPGGPVGFLHSFFLLLSVFPQTDNFMRIGLFFVVFFHYYYIAFVSRYNIAECLLRFLYVSNDPPCYFRRRRRLPRVLTPVFNSSSRAVSTSSVTRASWRPSAPARVWIVLSGSSRS